MPVETDFQTQIINSLRAQGGYGRKWASSMQVGPPDLVCALGFSFVAEVKLIKDVKPGWDRKEGPTAKQMHEMQQYVKGGGIACVLVVVYYHPTKVLLVRCPVNLTRLTEEEALRLPHVWRKTGLAFDMFVLLDGLDKEHGK